MRLRLGTRGSPLALAQARLVQAALVAAHGWEAEAVAIVPITTDGDRIQDRPLAELGGKALWTKTLDRALAEGRTDASVHSLKDVETERPAWLTIAAVLPRADVRDRLLGADSIAALPDSARVGTSSPRRAAQLLRLRPDLRIVPFRGNVATRRARLRAGEADATLLAAAGLDRLGHSDVGAPMPTALMLPAVGQGVVAIETRTEGAGARALLAAIDHAPTYYAVAAERAFLARLGGNCHSPVGVLAEVEGDGLCLRAQILTEDGALERAGAVRLAAGDGQAPAALAAALLADAPPRLAGLFACAS